MLSTAEKEGRIHPKVQVQTIATGHKEKYKNSQIKKSTMRVSGPMLYIRYSAPFIAGYFSCLLHYLSSFFATVPTHKSNVQGYEILTETSTEQVYVASRLVLCACKLQFRLWSLNIRELRGLGIQRFAFYRDISIKYY